MKKSLNYKMFVWRKSLVFQTIVVGLMITMLVFVPFARAVIIGTSATTKPTVATTSVKTLKTSSSGSAGSTMFATATHPSITSLFTGISDELWKAIYQGREIVMDERILENYVITFSSHAFELCLRGAIDRPMGDIELRDLMELRLLSCGDEVESLEDVRHLFDFTVVKRGTWGEPGYLEGVVHLGMLLPGQMVRDVFEPGIYNGDRFIHGLASMSTGEFTPGRLVKSIHNDDTYVTFVPGIDRGDVFVPGLVVDGRHYPGILLDDQFVPGLFHEGIFYPVPGYEGIIEGYHDDSDMAGLCSPMLSDPEADLSLGATEDSCSGISLDNLLDPSDPFGGGDAGMGSGVSEICRGGDRSSRIGNDGNIFLGCDQFASLEGHVLLMQEASDRYQYPRQNWLSRVQAQNEYLIHAMKQHTGEIDPEKPCMTSYGGSGGLSGPGGLGDPECGTPWGDIGFGSLPDLEIDFSSKGRVDLPDPGPEYDPPADAGRGVLGRYLRSGACAGMAVGIAVTIVTAGNVAAGIGAGMATVGLFAGLGNAEANRVEREMLREQAQSRGEEAAAENPEYRDNVTDCSGDCGEDWDEWVGSGE